MKTACLVSPNIVTIVKLIAIITKTTTNAEVFVIPFAVKWKNTKANESNAIMNNTPIFLSDCFVIVMWKRSAKNSSNLAHNCVSMYAIANPNVNKLAIFEVANAGVVAPINPITAARFAFAGSINLNASIEATKRTIHPPNPHKIALKVPPDFFCQEIVNFLSKITIPIISKIKDPTVKCKYVCPNVILTLVATNSNQIKVTIVIAISFT